MPERASKTSIAFTAILIWAAVASAQKLDFEKLSSELGLSQNLILCLLQDSQGFLWVGTKDGLNRYDGYRFTTFRYDPFDSLSISDNLINGILEDRHGRMWVATGKGIDLFDREKEAFYNFPRPVSNATLAEGPYGSIWQAGACLILPPDGQGIERLQIGLSNLERDSQNHFTTPVWDNAGNGFAVKHGNDLYRVRYDSLLNRFQFSQNFEDLPGFFEKKTNSASQGANPYKRGRDGRIWQLANGKIMCWDALLGKMDALEVPARFTDPAAQHEVWGNFTACLEDGKGRLWLGGFNGSFRIDLASRDFRCFSPEPTDKSDPLVYGLTTLLEDAGGLVWVGTRGNGLLKYNDNARRFVTAAGAPGLWRGESLRALFKTSDGRVWLGSMGGGLLMLDANTREITKVAPAGSAFKGRQGVFQCFFQSENGVFWCGNSDWGLMRLSDWQGGKPHFEVFAPEPDKMGNQISSAPTGIVEDAARNLWLVSPDALRSFNVQTKTFEKFPFFNGDAPRIDRNRFPAIFQDRRGRLWIGTSEGLWRFDKDKETFEKYQNERSNPNSLSHDLVKCIAEDPVAPERFLFVGTGGGGLNRFDTEKGSFEKFTEKDGLPDMVVYGMLPDAAGNLWLSTNKGLSVFNPKTRVFRNFDQTDGLQNLEFNTCAYAKSADGQLFFGGIEGFNAFYPDKMLQANTHVPNIVFTDFKISGKSVSHKTEDSPLNVAIGYAQKIVLTPDTKVISIEFAALDFAAPLKNQFSCKMEGFDRDWQTLGTTRSVTYTNLAPGKYTFKVRGSNNDGLWNELGASLEIEVLAPWWATWWAYLLYALTIGGVVFAFARLQAKRNQANAEARRLQELNEAKSQFLSTVSHELRTPLTSIMGFTKIIKKRLEERILPKTDVSDPKTSRAAAQVMDNLAIVVNESERLTALINEVLDLAKIESGKIDWQEETLRIDELVNRAVDATAVLFEHKKLRLQREIAAGLPPIVGDPDRLLQVLVNLLSNAVKFTERGGAVISAQLQGENTILLGVSDTGSGIPKEYQLLVFEKFRQVTNDTLTDKPKGTGLGLPICKEIVEHHGGRIWVESEAGAGCTFWFTLPVR